MSDCHPSSLSEPPSLRKGYCIACREMESDDVTTDGAFCTATCESNWVSNCLAVLSVDECLDLMAAVMTRIEEVQAEKARKWVKVFVAGA